VTMLRMEDLDLKGKRVLMREDLNVPMKSGRITSDARIRAAIPSIKLALKKGAALMILSHLGRPAAGAINPDLSLQPVADRLSELLKKPVRLAQQWLDGVTIEPGEIVLCENTRFNFGEKENSAELAKIMADLCDVFVMDAFATAHRAEASTAGISEFAKVACAGPLLAKEIEALDKVMSNPKRPLVAIVGGAKVSTKLLMLDSLSQQVDGLVVGGGIANTFIASQGYSVGDSLYEPDLIDEAERIIGVMKTRGADLPLPKDVVVAESLKQDAESYDEEVEQVTEGEKIFDIGPETTKSYVELLKRAGTILWNGPLGAFEVPQFSLGTAAIAKAVAASNATKVAGGGDTLLAIERYQIADKIDYISTGGGAFLAYLEGKDLPAIKALKAREVA
jgi:phosphoglycerate kinase